MSPNIYPGVQIQTTDDSSIITLNTSMIIGMVGQFEKGPDDVPMLVNSKSFLQYFGTYIQNCPDIQKYISAVTILSKATGITCLNVTHNALYGGLEVKQNSITPFSTGVATIGTNHDTYNFINSITNEVSKTGDGSTKTFNYIVTTPGNGLVPNSIIISYKIGATTYTATDNGLGQFTGTDISSSLITYSTGNISVTFTSAPTNLSNITTSYEYNSLDLFALVAVSKGVWSNNIGITISSVDTLNNNFTIQVWETDTITNITSNVETLTVSRVLGATDGFGKPIYIDNVFANESTRFYAINNTNMDTSIMPAVNIVTQFASGGNSGTTPTSTDYANAINLFNNPNVEFDAFCGAGITDPAVITAIGNLVNETYKVAYIDSISGTASSVVTYMNTTLNIDNMRLFIYTPFQYTFYNGVQYYTPLSALAATQKAVRVANGELFMPPAGIGTDRGSINSTQEFYYSQADALTMHEVDVNVCRKIQGYGNVLFTDFTMQKRLSATSYQSSVETLNNMIVQCQNLLLVINFKVINDSTFLQIETLLKGYLDQLATYEGTIEPGSYTIDFSDNNATTKDAGQILVKIIFVFQNLVRTISLDLVYVSNQLYSTISGI